MKFAQKIPKKPVEKKPRKNAKAKTEVVSMNSLNIKDAVAKIKRDSVNRKFMSPEQFLKYFEIWCRVKGI